MTTSTVLLLLLSVLIASAVSFYHYLYKADKQLKINWILALLRFTSIFLLLLLLINPVISSKSTEINKIPLAIVTDNSSSIKELKADQKALELTQILKNNCGLFTSEFKFYRKILFRLRANSKFERKLSTFRLKFELARDFETARRDLRPNSNF